MVGLAKPSYEPKRLQAQRIENGFNPAVVTLDRILKLGAGLGQGHGKHSSRSIIPDQFPLQPRGELLMMFWATGAASIGGFVITALFAIVAIGQIAKRAAQRSARKRYATGLVSVGFSCLVIVCACCLARLLIDAETPPTILLSFAVSGRFSPNPPCPEWGSVALLPGDGMPRPLVCYAYDAQQGGYRQAGP